MDDCEHGVLAAATFLFVEVACTFDRETTTSFLYAYRTCLHPWGVRAPSPKVAV